MPFCPHHASSGGARSRLAYVFAVFAAVASLSFAGAPAQSQAQSAVPDARIEKLRPGKHWAGPAIDEGTLRGKVVLVELWGS